MTPGNSGLRLCLCDNPRWCPSTWQAAQWSSSGAVAQVGSCRLGRTCSEEDDPKTAWAGTRGSGRALRSKRGGKSGQRGLNVPAQGALASGFQGPSSTQRKGGSGAKGHLVKEHHDPQSCQFLRIKYLPGSKSGGNLSHKSRHRTGSDVRTEASAVLWKTGPTLYLDHSHVSGEKSLSQACFHFVDPSERLENERSVVDFF